MEFNVNVPDAAAYTDESIRHLSDVEHIRLRPGMYIGKLGDGSQSDDGVYVLLKEVIDNSIDEFIMGCGKRVDVKIEGNVASVRDYGRGIPLEKLGFCSIRLKSPELINVSEQDAAAVMAITSHKTGIPLENLYFKSIKLMED